MRKLKLIMFYALPIICVVACIALFVGGSSYIVRYGNAYYFSFSTFFYNFKKYFVDDIERFFGFNQIFNNFKFDTHDIFSTLKSLLNIFIFILNLLTLPIKLVVLTFNMLYVLTGLNVLKNVIEYLQQLSFTIPYV